MAGRPKKTQTVEEKNTVDITQELMKKLEEMQNQLAELKAENDSLRESKQVEYNDTDDEITADTDIVVISQFIGKLVISTEGNGAGNVYRFDKFGDVQDIPFGDLKLIVKNKPNFAKEGLYYIANEKAVKKLRLNRDYENIVDSNVFTHLLDENSDVIIKAYKDAPTLQKEQIVAMIEDRINRNQDVDGNVLVKIGKLCGKDFLRVDDDEE